MNTLLHNKDGIKLGIRAAIAITIAFFLGGFIDAGSAIWIPISTIVVLRLSVGGTIDRTISRIAGVGIGFILCIPFYHYILMPYGHSVIWILVWLFIAMVAVKYSYFWTMLFSTLLVLCLIANYYPNGIAGNTDIHYVLLRFYSVALGAIIGGLSSLLIFPQTSYYPLRQATAKLFDNIHTYIDDLIQLQNNTEGRNYDFDKQQQVLITQITAQNGLLNELKHEPGRFAKVYAILIQLPVAEQRLLQTLLILSHLICDGKLFKDTISAEIIEKLQQLSQASLYLSERMVPHNATIKQESLMPSLPKPEEYDGLYKAIRATDYRENFEYRQLLQRNALISQLKELAGHIREILELVEKVPLK